VIAPWRRAGAIVPGQQSHVWRTIGYMISLLPVYVARAFGSGTATTAMDPTLDLSRDEVRPYWNAAVYAVCLYALGFGLVKSSLVGILVLLCVLLRYGSRWVMRGGFAILVLTILVWLNILPPIGQWHDNAAHLMGLGNGYVSLLH
jgi:hypothetical protein